MFNSSKICNSPRTNNSNLYNNANETANGISRSFIQPKITSTPVNKRDSIFATPPKQRMLSPRRYSLSEIATPPRSSTRDLTGPLLASTNYSVNVSTYEDTKSPGLAGRIVQYNEETEREREQARTSTHQAKYGSPGLFPIVHLFKKNLPMLEQKPRKVTIRIASPDYARHHSQEYNRKLLEGIVRPTSPTYKGSPFSSPSQSRSSTRSVLDALKEISRKRIHANEEFDLNEDSGKRLRVMQNGDSNKRLRDDSPPDKSPSPNKPTSKRVCMYDEYAASCSSMDFSFKNAEQPESKRKYTSISTLTDNSNQSKQVKLINAETQTITNEATDNSGSQEEEGQDKIESVDEPVKKKTSPLKIFDDAPLERIRKNRLAALMGSLTGKDPVLLPKPDYASVLNSAAESANASVVSTSEASKSAEKPLVSILSSPKKLTPTKSNKHVHFSVPESTSQTTLNSASMSSFPITATPIVSVGEAKITFGSLSNAAPEILAPPSSPVGLQPCSSETTMILPTITFGSGSNSSSSTSIVSKESSTSLVVADASKTGISIPSFQFMPPTPSISAAAASVASSVSNSTPTVQLTFPPATTSIPTLTTSPPKMGGFKFDLSKPVVTSATATPSSIPTFSFGSSSQSNVNKTGIGFGSASTTTSSSGTFGIGAKVASPATTTSGVTFSAATTFGTTSPAPSVGAVTATPNFNFGSVNGDGKHATPVGFLPQLATTSVPTFASNTSASISVPTVTTAPAFGTSSVPLFSFGAPKSTAALPAFGVPASATPSVVAFGAPTTTASSFGANTIALSSGFGTNTVTPTPSSGMVANTSTTPSGFGVNTNIPSSGFGTNPTTPSSGFGTNPTTPSSGFGTNPTTPSSGFGSNSTAPSGGFGSNSTTPSSGFGSNSTTPSSGFGVNSSNLSAGFGTNPVAASNSFLNTSTPQTLPAVGFGATTAASTLATGFGSSTTSAASFASNAAPMFGVNKSASPFAVTTSATPTFISAPTGNPPPYAASNNQQFGQSTTHPTFGTPTTTASFGSSNAFGGTTTTSSGFGNATNSSVFAAKSAGFGPPSNNSNIFGGVVNTQASGFGTSTAKAAFGSAAASPFNVPTKTTVAPSFGSANTPSFNFGAKTTNSSFGGSNSFGTTTTASIGFGSNTTPAYGATNSFGPNSSFGSNNAFPNISTPSFGTTISTQPSGFGTTNTTSFGTANTGFTTGEKSSGFGNSSVAPTFGTNSAPPFGGSASTGGFGATNNTSGFGTNAAMSAFAKPQATQNAFGTPTSNAFAANKSFGGSQPQVPNFGPSNPSNTQSGVFNFGGAATPKPPGVFSFGGGGSNEVPKSFNFTGSNAAPPAFGNSGMPAFGNSNAAPFGASAVPQFNAPQPAQGMFSIGSGSSSSGKTRTLLKPKRRT